MLFDNFIHCIFAESDSHSMGFDNNVERIRWVDTNFAGL